MSRKLVIVGGVAGGATAAARARRLDEKAEIVVIERGREVSFANCGLPYHIGGEIVNRDALLVQTKSRLTKVFNLDIRTRHEVTRVDRANKRVHVRDLESGREYDESYDALLLSPGASPIVPPVPGVNHPAIYTLRNMADMDCLKRAVDSGARTAIVVGGGFIGLEAAENLKRRGLDVAVVEMLPQVMPPLDPEIANRLHAELAAHDVQLHLSDAVEAFEDRDGLVSAKLKSGVVIDADLAVLAAGVKPESTLAKDAGLTLGERGAIVVDEHMRTSDPSIYAVGDAVQTTDCVLGGETLLPLAGPANRQARIAVDNIMNRETKYVGVRGTSVVRVFGVTAAATGASEKTLKRRNTPYQKVYVHRAHHVSYFPGAQQMHIKLLFAPSDGRILGAQIVGGDGVDKRIDVIATAMQANMTVEDLQELELAYAPQYGAAKDPINIAGYVATNAWKGDEKFVMPEDLDSATIKQWTVIDVREPAEYEAGHIDGARLIPLGEIRSRWTEIPTDKPIATYCGVGQRSYYANRILQQLGVEAHNLAGGFSTYRVVHQAPPTPRALSPRNANVTVREVDTEMRADASDSGGCCGGGEERGEADRRAATATVAVVAAPTGTSASPEVTLDLRGLQCPGPLARLAACAKENPGGTMVKAVATDVGFQTDVKAWAQRSGHEVLAVERRENDIWAQIKLGALQEVRRQPATDSAALADLKRTKTIVVFSGDLDRVMGAFVIANAAADLGDKVTLFFTFWGLNALRRSESVSVKKDFMSRMFGWMMPRGATKLALSKMNMAGMGTAMMKGVMRRKKVDDLPTLIASAQRKGVRLVACSMSMDVMGLAQEELIDGVEVAGAAGYLADASESGVNLFI